MNLIWGPGEESWQMPSVGFNRPALFLRRNILCCYTIFFNFLSSSDRWNARTDLLPTRVVEVSATEDGIFVCEDSVILSNSCMLTDNFRLTSPDTSYSLHC